MLPNNNLTNNNPNSVIESLRLGMFHIPQTLFAPQSGTA